MVFGKTTTESVELSDLPSSQGGFAIRGESIRSVSGAGDVNGDGLADLLMGTHYGNTSYLVFGKRGTEAIVLSDVASGRGGFAIHEESVGDYSGSSVSGAGDVNGDGIPDLAIGTHRRSYGGMVDGKAYVVFGPPRDGGPPFVRGDANADGATDLSDAVVILGFLFLGDPENLEDCQKAGDADDNGKLNLTDAVYLLNFKFLGGKAPLPPFLTCGVDTDTPDNLPCERFPPCQ